MQVSIETTSGLERKLTVGVPAERIENEVNDRIQKASKTVRLDGFRKGRVPLNVIKQRYGDGIRQEVIGEVMGKTFYEAVAQQEVVPAGQPAIEPVNNKPGEDLEYIAIFEVYPEVTLADFSSVEVGRPVSEVTDADLDNMIDVLRKQQSTWTIVERAAADGDQVNIDYLGTKDGEEFAGGKAEGSDLVLGSKQMIPGFEDAVAGLSAGEEVEANLAFPEDYHAEELKGAAVVFKIKLNSVSENTLPELNEEFFEKYGVSEGGEEKFREEVRGNMERELKNAVQNKVKGRIMDQLLELHQLDAPKAMVGNEIQTLKQQMLQQFGGGGNSNFDTSMLPDEMFTEQADRRVKLGLIINEVIKQAELKVDPDQLRSRIEEVASTYEQPEEVVQYYYSNQQLLQGMESAVLEEQVVEHVLASASVTEEAVGYEDAIQPDPQPGAEQGDS